MGSAVRQGQQEAASGRCDHIVCNKQRQAVGTCEFSRPVRAGMPTANGIRQASCGVVSLCTTTAINRHTLLKHASMYGVWAGTGTAAGTAAAMPNALCPHVYKAGVRGTYELKWCHATGCSSCAICVWCTSTAMRCVVGQAQIGVHYSRGRAVKKGPVIRAN